MLSLPLLDFLSAVRGKIKIKREEMEIIGKGKL